MNLSNEDKSNFPSLEIVFDEVRRRIESQHHSIESLNTRAGILLGLCALILTSSIWSWQSLLPAIWLKIILLVLILVSASCSLLGYMVKSYRMDPAPGPLVDEYLEKEINTTKRQILVNWVESYSENERKIDDKVRLIMASLWSLVSAIIFVIVICVLLLTRIY